MFTLAARRLTQRARLPAGSYVVSMGDEDPVVVHELTPENAEEATAIWAAGMDSCERRTLPDFAAPLPSDKLTTRFPCVADAPEGTLAEGEHTDFVSLKLTDPTDMGDVYKSAPPHCFENKISQFSIGNQDSSIGNQESPIEN